jgi:hypothetical protein
VFPEFFGVSFDAAVGEFQSKLREPRGTPSL